MLLIDILFRYQNIHIIERSNVRIFKCAKFHCTWHFAETLRELSFKYPLSDVMSVWQLSNIFLADKTRLLKEKFLNRYIKYNKPKQQLAHWSNFARLLPFNVTEDVTESKFMNPRCIISQGRNILYGSAHLDISYNTAIKTICDLKETCI